MATAIVESGYESVETIQVFEKPKVDLSVQRLARKALESRGILPETIDGAVIGRSGRSESGPQTEIDFYHLLMTLPSDPALRALRMKIASGQIPPISLPPSVSDEKKSELS
jgi:hypothetical protein